MWHLGRPPYSCSLVSSSIQWSGWNTWSLWLLSPLTYLIFLYSNRALLKGIWIHGCNPEGENSGCLDSLQVIVDQSGVTSSGWYKHPAWGAAKGSLRQCSKPPTSHHPLAPEQGLQPWESKVSFYFSFLQWRPPATAGPGLKGSPETPAPPRFPALWQATVASHKKSQADYAFQFYRIWFCASTLVFLTLRYAFCPLFGRLIWLSQILF